MNIWDLYIEYLKEWANNHKDNKFYGMSPICFEEYKDAEEYNAN